MTEVRRAPQLILPIKRNIDADPPQDPFAEQAIAHTGPTDSCRLDALTRSKLPVFIWLQQK